MRSSWHAVSWLACLMLMLNKFIWSYMISYIHLMSPVVVLRLSVYRSAGGNLSKCLFIVLFCFFFFLLIFLWELFCYTPFRRKQNFPHKLLSAACHNITNICKQETLLLYLHSTPRRRILTGSEKLHYWFHLKCKYIVLLKMKKMNSS